MSPTRITQHPLYASLSERSEWLFVQLRQVPAQRWRWLCLAVVSLWIVHNLVSAVWLVAPAPELEQPPLAQPVTADGAAASSASVDLSSLQELALFGQGGEAPAAEVEPEQAQAMLPGIEQDAVDTSLNLRLQGVMASSNPDNAWAIIADGNDQALYTIGDTLPRGNNVSLVKVLEQRVILDNNGRYESLWLYSKEDVQQRSSAGRGPAPAPAEADSARDEDEAGYREYEEQDAMASAPEEVDAPDEPTEEPEVRSLPSSAAEEVQSISEVVRFTAARGEDGMMGYQVQPGTNPELFEQAGLQPGDIVTAVNGIGLDDPRQIRAVYQEMQTANQAELSVMRDGEPISIQITLDSTR